MRIAARIGLGLACAAFAATPEPARAACVETRAFFTASGPYVTYLYTPGNPFDGPYGPGGRPYGYSVTYYVRGYFWAFGAGHPVYGLGADHGNRGGYGFTSDWLYAGVVGGHRSFIGGPYGHWQRPGTDGCITDAGSNQNNIDADECMVVVVSDQDFRGHGFAAVLAQSTAIVPPFAGDFPLFRVSDGDPIHLAALPPPAVRSAVSTGKGEVEAQVSVPALAGAADGLYLNCTPTQNQQVVRGYQLVAAQVPAGGKPPSSRLQCARRAADCRYVGGRVDWTDVAMTDALGRPIDVAPLGSDVRAHLRCGQASDVYLATALVLDSGFRTPYVSANSVVVPCGSCSGADFDRDGFCADAQGTFPADCDDTDATVHPGALELCDGRRNDCSDPTWPAVPANELDLDGDSFAACNGDCDDATAAVSPVAPEACNGADDNCNDLADEDLAGTASDGDALANACDNCPLIDNPDQADLDEDGRGDECDPCTDRDHDGFGSPGDGSCGGGPAVDCQDRDPGTHPAAPEVYDGRDNDCDGSVDEALDADGDGIPDFRDGCPDTLPGSGVDPFGCAACLPGGGEDPRDPPGSDDEDDENADDEDAGHTAAPAARGRRSADGRNRGL